MKFDRILAFLADVADGKMPVDSSDTAKSYTENKPRWKAGDAKFDFDSIVASKSAQWKESKNSMQDTVKGGSDATPADGNYQPPDGFRWRKPGDPPGGKSAEAMAASGGDPTGADIADTIKEIVQDEGADEGDPTRGGGIVDRIQQVLDFAGIIDPTPILDGINATISTIRTKTDPDRAEQHKANAKISAISMIPYLGDSAKLARYNKGGMGYLKAAGEAAESDTGRQVLTEAGKLIVEERKKKSVGPAPAGPDGKAYYQPGGAPISAPEDALLSRREDDEGVKKVDETVNAYDKLMKKTLDVAGAFGKVVLGVTGFLTGVRTMNAGILAMNRELGEVHGGVAATYAQAEVKDIRRNIEKGDALNGPLAALSEETSELKDSFQEVMLPFLAIAIQIMTLITKVANVVIKFAVILNPLISVLEWLVSWIPGQGGNANPQAPWRQFMADVSDGQLDGKRPIFNGGRRAPFGSQQILPPQDHQDVFGP